MNELARRNRARIRRYVRLVAELQRSQRRAERGSGGDVLRSKMAEERRTLLDLVGAAQSLINDAGHKAGTATARRLADLLRDAALREPKALENGTLTKEERPAGWNLASHGQARSSKP